MPDEEPIQFVASAGYDADRKTADENRVVVLHQWEDGCLLVMYFDSEMPAFTAKEQTPEETEATVRQVIADAARVPAKKHPPELEATGYVFAAYEPTPTGLVIFNGERYLLLEIVDSVVWSDDDEVRAKYLTVLAEAKTQP